MKKNIVIRKPTAKSNSIPEKKSKFSLQQDCPVFLTLGLIANKWSIQLLYHLLHANAQTLRFSELKKSLASISQRELTKHLREFEKAGLVARTVYPQVPPRVEYTLTSLGNSLFKPIEALSAWAKDHGEQVQEHRRVFEKLHHKTLKRLPKT